MPKQTVEVMVKRALNIVQKDPRSVASYYDCKASNEILLSEYDELDSILMEYDNFDAFLQLQ